MHRKTIYFNQKSLHRERQADTAKYASEFFDVISPLKKEVDNIATFNKIPLYMKIISWIVARIPMINLRKMPKIAGSADYIYTWWDIPLFSSKPFVVELDNPYVLTFYNYFAFKLYKPIIRRLLRSERCKKIVCISHACRETFLKEMGKSFDNKTVVLYPRMKDFTQKIIRKDDKIKFIFVWLQAKLKWLYELLEAFHSIRNDAGVLEIIGLQDVALEKKYQWDKRIQFLGQMARKDIVDLSMPTADVLVFPTYFESFGIVALEALSRGLGIITTNVFALPEVCQDGYNGKVIAHPYLKANSSGFVDVTKMTINAFVKKYLDKEDIDHAMVSDLKKAMELALENYTTWKEHSEILYQEKFSQKAREKSFLEIFA